MITATQPAPTGIGSAPSQLTSIQALRGLAALSVAWFHFTQSPGYADGIVRASGAYGYLGVDAFFVISGFILPHVLHARGYERRLYGRFMAKRFLRLEPPYLVGVALAVILQYISSVIPGYAGAPFDVTWTDILLHLGYLNQLLGTRSFNPVFWSLAIEVQWYLVLGLIFPLLRAGNGPLRLTLLAMSGVVPWLIPSEALLFHFAPLFMMGVLTYQRKAGVIEKGEYVGGLAFLVAACLFSVGILTALAGAVSVIALATVTLANRSLLWLGGMSYSLYLAHVPIGGRVMNLSLKLGLTGAPRLLAPIAALVVSILAAGVLYRLVEKPSMMLSAKIRY